MSLQLKENTKNTFFNIKWSPLILLAVLFLIFFYFDFDQFLSLDHIKSYQLIAQRWSVDHYLITVSLYLLIFILLIACGIPCGTVLTLLGGFLFGNIAILYAILGTTGGGLVLYFAVRTSLGARIANKSSGWIKQMESSFQENAFNYLLTLRLMPVFPCWLSNISAGLLNVPLKTFLTATIIGITPATIIYVLAARSLDKLVSNAMPLSDIILTPSICFPLVGLAILSLFPVIYKRIKKSN